MEPDWVSECGTVKLWNRDCRTALHSLPDASVQTCVTSPPYFGLRDYGCEGQIGLESTPDEFVATMVEVFREVRRVLKDDGTLWLNLGDTYNSNPSWGRGHSTMEGRPQDSIPRLNHTKVAKSGCKPKDLLGIPWRVAFALQADGWYLRQDIIWHKPNPMPESVRDRCTKAHEYVFLLSKSARYYFDAEAIAEPMEAASIERYGYAFGGAKNVALVEANKNGVGRRTSVVGDREATPTRNKRSVWTITTKPYSEAHFATFPPDLISPCILAGAREGDVVLDPFTGSGTTLAESHRLGRHAAGIELNPTYCELVKRRVSTQVCSTPLLNSIEPSPQQEQLFGA